MKRVAIIGGGVGGLAAACLLAKAGYRVDVYERHQQLGGRAGQLRVKGFTFDTGPSWLLMPEVFARFFERLGERLDDWLECTTLDPAVRFTYADGSTFIIANNLKQTLANAERLHPGAGQALERYASRMEHVYQIVLEHFLYKSYQHPLYVLPNLLQARTLPWHSSLSRDLARSIHDPRLRQALMLPSLFLGTQPDLTPALYGMLNHSIFSGVRYPMGGIFRLVEAFVAIGQRLGVHYHLESSVTAIGAASSQAMSVTVDGEERPADIVVSDAGICTTEQLLPLALRDHTERFWKQCQWSPSALLLYLGVDRQYSSLAHHNIIVSPDWEQDVRQIFDGTHFPTSPSIYVCAPSRTDATVAPSGCENLFVLAPLPLALRYTQTTMQQYADRIIGLLQSRLGLADLGTHLTFRKMFAADDFRNHFGTPHSSMLGLSHTLGQSAFFRPPAVSKRLRNVYYVGADVQPGIGLPAVVISAELLVDQLLSTPNGIRERQ